MKPLTLNPPKGLKDYSDYDKGLYILNLDAEVGKNQSLLQNPQNIYGHQVSFNGTPLAWHEAIQTCMVNFEGISLALP